jgi:SARP family transcriptional regulator, regulator of embCAB operon
VVELAGQRVDGLLPGRQGRSLFAYLVLNRHRLASRDELCACLWPAQAPAGSETTFNALLSKLRKAIAPVAIDGRSSLRLQLDDDAWVDIEVAEAAVHRAESRIVLGNCKSAWGASLAALFIAEREFLPGEEAPWIADQRARLAQVRRRALEAYASAALGTGGTELPAAVRAGRQLVRLDPLRETGYQILMQALAAQGNAAEALRIYADLREVLRDELGVSPSAPIEAVYQSLLR